MHASALRLATCLLAYDLTNRQPPFVFKLTVSFRCLSVSASCWRQALWRESSTLFAISAAKTIMPWLSCTKKCGINAAEIIEIGRFRSGKD